MDLMKSFDLIPFLILPIMADDLTIRFERALKHVNQAHTPLPLSNDQKLRFYGLYKQATLGPCQGPRPSMWDLTARYKWDAWNKVLQLTKEEAMLLYLEEMNALDPDWEKDEEEPKEEMEQQQLQLLEEESSDPQREEEEEEEEEESPDRPERLQPDNEPPQFEAPSPLERVDPKASLLRDDVSYLVEQSTHLQRRLQAVEDRVVEDMAEGTLDRSLLAALERIATSIDSLREAVTTDWSAHRALGIPMAVSVGVGIIIGALLVPRRR